MKRLNSRLTLEKIWEWDDKKSFESRLGFIKNTKLVEKTGIEIDILAKLKYKKLPKIVVDTLRDVINGDYDYGNLRR